MMKVSPNVHFERVTEISADFIRLHNIRAVILDIDNTITPDGSDAVSAEVRDWIAELCVPVFFLSNGKSKRVKYFAEMFDADYISNARKPSPNGCREAASRMGIADMETIAVIGDQLLSDMLGGNLAGCFTVKVPPLDPRSDPLTVKAKRLIEKLLTLRF